MSNSKLVRPAYAETFRCIGSACEDTCCKGWSVPIDKLTYEKYQNLPQGELRSLVLANIQLAPEGAESSDGYGPDLFAKIAMTASNQCPLLSADQLCRIQAEVGADLLSHSCATYPRVVHSVVGMKESALSLSCPEAARLVLLRPMRLASGEEPAAEHNEENPNLTALPFQSWFLAFRASALDLIRNRTYPLWQRMFLLSIFCRRLDAIAAGDLNRDLPSFLREFEGAVATGALRSPMEALPADGPAQMDVVLRLAGMMLYRSNVTKRFADCIHAFTTGIGNGPEATLETLTAQYSQAFGRYFTPFFDRHPHILENYLINTIMRCQFPFGRDGMKPGALPSLTREFTKLTAQFALMKGLLIGVSGFHREKFSIAHVVHTVQAASKHFEHHPQFVDHAYALLVESRMDGARGFGILLRNAGPVPAKPAQQPIHVPGLSSGRVAV